MPQRGTLLPDREGPERVTRCPAVGWHPIPLRPSGALPQAPGDHDRMSSAGPIVGCCCSIRRDTLISRMLCTAWLSTLLPGASGDLPTAAFQEGHATLAPESNLL